MKYLFNQEISPRTKTEQAEIAGQISSMILDGSIDPLEAFIELKAMANVIASVLKNPRIEDAVLDEISKYEVSKNAFGVTVGKGSTGNKYDFSGIEHVTAQEEIIKLKTDTLKQMKAALIAQYHAGIKVASMDDGEELKIKMIEPGRETIKITFGK